MNGVTIYGSRSRVKRSGSVMMSPNDSPEAIITAIMAILTTAKDSNERLRALTVTPIYHDGEERDEYPFAVDFDIEVQDMPEERNG